MRHPRPWRRRAIVAAAALAVGMLLAPGQEATPAPAGPSPAVRTPRERTLGLAPGSGFVTEAYATDTTRQQLTVRAPRADGDPAYAQVTAYEPGAFEPESLSRGALVLVGGHSAWYGNDAWHGTNPVPTVAWRTTYGTWVSVTGTGDRSTLFRLARAVRLHPPVPVAAPVGLTWLPTGLALASAQIGDGKYAATFTARRRRTYDLRLSAYPVTSDDWTNGTLGLGAPSHTVAGYNAWYSEKSNSSQLLVEAGRCGVRIQVSDATRLPLSVLDRMLRVATIGSCDGFGDWPPILSR